MVLCLFVFFGGKGWAVVFFPTRQEGVVRFYVGIRVCDASTPRPHPASCHSSQSSSPADLAEYPARAARQWIPPSIPPELLVSGSCPVSRQSCPAEYPAEYPRVARQWIPPSIPPASGSRRVAHQRPPVDPAESPAEYPRVARQCPLSILAE